MIMKTNIVKKQSRYSLILSVVIAMIFAVSCEDVIDTAPYTSIDENAAFSTPALCELSVTGMYNAAQLGYYDGAYRGYPFGAAFVEQGDTRGEDVVNRATFYAISYQGTYSNTSANNVWMWSDTYRLINRCNIVLEGAQTALNNGIITEEVAHRYMGEAMAFRAMAHLELLFHFAYPYKHTADASHMGVPYRTVANTSQEAIAENMALGRNTVAECYQKILQDFDQAEQYLPKRSETDLPVTRFTAEAVAALKSNVYMHMWDWDKVLTETSKFTTGIYASSGVGLEAEPGGCFDQRGYSPKENIFSMLNTVNNNPGVNAALGSMYNNRVLVCISPIIWRNSFWLHDDKRRTEDEMVFTYSNQKFTYKYKEAIDKSDGTPVIRYAEVLLNEAEAYVRNAIADGEITVNQNALTSLNKVRDRALANPATQSYTAVSIAAAATLAGLSENVYLLKAILAERRIELLMEGRRWPDIHRLQFCPYFPINGIPGKVANGSVPGASYDLTSGTEYSGTLYYAAPYPVGGDVNTYVGGYKFLWPLPAIETNSNPVLAEQQNPGY